ncbi:hypothetical protein ACFL0Y_03780 [Patescibacteria group bacterium]
MDKSTKKLYKSGCKLIDIEREEEISRINKEFQKKGFSPNDGITYQAHRPAIKRAVWEKKKLKAELELQAKDPKSKKKPKISKPDKYNYDPHSKQFTIYVRGKWRPIKFSTQRNKRYQVTLFEILFYHWEANGNTPIFKHEIIKKASKKLHEELDSQWFKNTFRHLNDKILDDEVLKNIIIFRKDKNHKGLSLIVNIKFK